MGTDEAGTRARFNDQFDKFVWRSINEHRGRLLCQQFARLLLATGKGIRGTFSDETS